jgi:hypothetical protein
MTEILPAALGTLQGLLVAVAALAGLFLGFCLLFNLTKFRRSGGTSRIVRGLDEVVGGRQTFLSPDAPRGPVDQLRTPELLEAQARKIG